MSKRPAVGRGLFYTRDSEGQSELAPPQYVAWAQARAKQLGVTFTGTPEAMQALIARKGHAAGDLYLDYGLSGNLLSRPGVDGFRQRALTDYSATHLFVPRRDRLSRPDNPLDAMAIEYELRSAGLTLVLMDKVYPPIPTGARIDPADLISCLMEYEGSGKFRRDLATKLIHAKVRLAQGGFSIGGEPVYGFRRWLCTAAGHPVRALIDQEKVKLPGHHVVWLPTAEDELAVVHRILDLIETVPATRIADILNAEGIPSPKAGRFRKINGVAVPNSGLWSQTTVRNIAGHSLLRAVWEYGKRAEGDQQRMTAAGPRDLGDADFDEDRKKKTVYHPDGKLIATPAHSPPVIPPDRHARIAAVLAERGKHQRGKPRARGDAPNPLGARVYDLNCGWPMYRYARRGRWAYQCGLYQNSQAVCCRHNVIDGPAASRFVLACLRQRALGPRVFGKLKEKLAENARAEQADDPAARQRTADEAALAGVRRRLATVSKNMALAESPEQRAATAAVFDELKAEEVMLADRLKASASPPAAADPEAEVAAALAVLGRLADQAEAADIGYSAITELVRATDARLYLRFREVQRGKQAINVPVGGVLTFGSAPPPGPLYEGPVDRPAIRRMMAAGELVSPVLGYGAQGQPEVGPEAGRSANVKRGTRRCSRPRGHVAYWRLQAPRAPAAAELCRSATLTVGGVRCESSWECSLFCSPLPRSAMTNNHPRRRTPAISHSLIWRAPGRTTRCW